MKKRLLACLLTAAMLVSLFPLPALATEAEAYTGGLCPHHQKHSYEVCGYVEAVEGQPCGFVCRICPVQALIDALPAPEDITANNRAEAEAQLAAIDTARIELTDEENGQLDVSRYQAVTSALTALDEQAGADVPMLADNPAGQFSALTPGNTYWFDLSETEIPGTVNTGNSSGAVTVPDTTLHWVPFTYVGTINAYVLNSASSGQTNASEDAALTTTAPGIYGYTYDHSLFIADYNVTHTVSWDGLNASDKNLIFGKTYTNGGVSYTMRAPSEGNAYTGSGENQRGTPQSNEWDVILNKGGSYIKNWSQIFSWGQDTYSSSANNRAARGRYLACRCEGPRSSTRDVYVGFRPVLELPAPDALTSGSLKVVTLNLNGGKAGTTVEAQNGPVNIVVKSGEDFTAPSGEGLTAPEGGVFGGWKSNGVVYQAGAKVPGTVTSLTAYWLIKPSITAYPENKTVSVGETATFTVTVSGDPAPTYQWQVNEDGGTNWKDIDGAAGSNYTTAAATMSMNGWRYRCVATNSQGSTESSAATLTVNKLTPTVTAPIAVSGLTYTGKAQNLISAGSTSGGELQYSLSANDGYSIDIPTGTNARDYTVYYKVVGNDNYNDVAAQSITVTIAKATPTPDTPTGLTATYDQMLYDVALPYGWSWDNSATPVGNVGDNTFSATFHPADTFNYNTVRENLTVTVSPAPRTITVTGQAGRQPHTGHLKRGHCDPQRGSCYLRQEHCQRGPGGRLAVRACVLRFDR